MKKRLGQLAARKEKLIQENRRLDVFLSWLDERKKNKVSKEGANDK